MTKSDFTKGNEVVIHFNGRDFRGVVKHSEPEYLITMRSQSPSPEPPAPVKKTEVEVAKSTGFQQPQMLGPSGPHQRSGVVHPERSRVS